jgi:hypothetical protein
MCRTLVRRHADVPRICPGPAQQIVPWAKEIGGGHPGARFIRVVGGLKGHERIEAQVLAHKRQLKF